MKNILVWLVLTFGMVLGVSAQTPYPNDGQGGFVTVCHYGFDFNGNPVDDEVGDPYAGWSGYTQAQCISNFATFWAVTQVRSPQGFSDNCPVNISSIYWAASQDGVGNMIYVLRVVASTITTGAQGQGVCGFIQQPYHEIATLHPITEGLKCPDVAQPTSDGLGCVCPSGPIGPFQITGSWSQGLGVCFPSAISFKNLDIHPNHAP